MVMLFSSTDYVFDGLSIVLLCIRIWIPRVIPNAEILITCLFFF